MKPIHITHSRREPFIGPRPSPVRPRHIFGMMAVMAAAFAAAWAIGWIACELHNLG